MATPTIAPPAVAPAPAASTPAAAPSTPVVSTPTPAPSPAPAAEPKSMEDKLGAAWKTAKDSVPLEEPAEPAAPEVAAAPVEEPAAPAAEPAAAAEPEKPAEAAAPEFELSLDDGDPASPETLFKELKADPAAQKFFEDRPELKNKVMAALRRDTENRELRKIVPDVETAKQMHQGATLYSQFDNHFLKATTPEGYKGFIDKWVEEAILLGDDGKPDLNADGTYKLHPSLPYIMNQIHSNQAAYALTEFKKSGEMTPQMRDTATAIADHFLQQATLKGDDRLEAAARIFKGALTPEPSATEEIPEHLKSLADSLKAKETALKESEQAAERQRQETERVAQRTEHLKSVERAETAAALAVKTQLKPLLASKGLSEYEQAASIRNIGDALDLALGIQNEDGSWTKGTAPNADWFQSQYDSILYRTPSEARELALKKLIVTNTNEILPTILTAEIRTALSGRIDRQATKQTTVEGQKKASQADPRGTSISAASPGQKISNADIEKEYMAAHDGEKPSLEYVLGEVMKRNRTPRPA